TASTLWCLTRARSYRSAAATATACINFWSAARSAMSRAQTAARTRACRSQSYKTFLCGGSGLRSRCHPAQVVPDVRTSHPENDIFGDIGRVIGHSLQVARDQQRVQSLPAEL